MPPDEPSAQVARLRELGWYHSLELPDGRVIEGLQSLERLQERVRQFPIPADLTGKRVLDIGAWDGWFSFEMERRGARVLAVDSAKNTRFLEAKSLLGSQVDYLVADICQLSSKEIGHFDIVLFFGVLYHLKHPILALERVCELATEMACVESYVTNRDASLPPLMEFYETTELRGQLDNWVGPNASCLLAFCRTAGFADVRLESVLINRAHVTCYRKWPPCKGREAPPFVKCINNAATHDHTFSSTADDYVAVYFSSETGSLTCDNVFVQIGPYGSRPVQVEQMGDEGWVAVAKLPPGLGRGWHEAMVRVAESSWSPPLRIGIDLPLKERQRTPEQESSSLRVALVTDGISWERYRVHVGDKSSLSLWVTGLSEEAVPSDVRVRLDGTDLPVAFLSGTDAEGRRQVNALLPSGLEPHDALLSLVWRNAESPQVVVQLCPLEDG